VLVLGISAHRPGAGVALISDGRVLARAREARFSGLPDDPAFPRQALRWCLDAAGANADQLDRVAWAELPAPAFDHALATNLAAFPWSGREWVRLWAEWLGGRAWAHAHVHEELDVPADRWVFCPHLDCRAASAFSASGFSDAAVLVADDAAEDSPLAVGTGFDGRIVLDRELPAVDSPLRLARLVLGAAGVPGDDPSRLAALTSTGRPRFRDDLARLVRFDDHGAPALDTKLLPPGRGPTRALRRRLARLGVCDGADLVASVDALLGDLAVRVAADLCAETRQRRVCVAGQLARWPGVKRRLDETFGPAEVYVADDDGDDAALGAALVAWGLAGEGRAPAAREAAPRRPGWWGRTAPDLGRLLGTFSPERCGWMYPALFLVLELIGLGLLLWWGGPTRDIPPFYTAP